MLDIGWTEIAVIVVVALIVIGPKDLPVALRTVAGWIRKARMLTREFQGHIDEMIREADLEDVRKKAVELKNLNVAKQVENTIDPTGSLRTAFEVDPAKPAEPGPAPAAEPAHVPAPVPVEAAAPAPVPATHAPASPAETEKRS
jgi:sec-independent protein translocase protein TatB